jgi:hypothetical protein
MFGIGSFADISKQADEKRLKERFEALLQLKTWYLTLIEAGSRAFEFEYWNRNGR